MSECVRAQLAQKPKFSLHTKTYAEPLMNSIDFSKHQRQQRTQPAMSCESEDDSSHRARR